MREPGTCKVLCFKEDRYIMSKKLFVGGLSWNTNDAGLRQSFSRFGEVTEANVINDRDTGRSRGFGFVTFANAPDADAAISAMDGSSLDGRTIKVNEATDKPPRSGGFGGGGGRGGFGGGGGRGGYGGGGGRGGDRGGYGGDRGDRGGYGGEGGGRGGRGGRGGGGGYGGGGDRGGYGGDRW